MRLRLVIFPEWKILGRREMRSQARRSTFAELFDAFATGRWLFQDAAGLKVGAAIGQEEFGV